MRIRSIKPEFWRSDDIAALPITARLLFIGLWSYVDDNGVGSDKVSSIAADLFAADLEVDPTETFRRVSVDTACLQERGLIIRYSSHGKNLLYVTNWESHQIVKNPSKGHQYPLPSGDLIDAAKTLRRPYGDSTETLGTGAGEQGSRGTGEQGSRNPPNPPRGETVSKRGTRIEADWIPDRELIEQMRAECPSVNLEAEHRIFIDYWIAQPGQKGVKLDWSATWRNWMRRKQSDAPRGPQASRAERAWDFVNSLEDTDGTQRGGDGARTHLELRQ